MEEIYKIIGILLLASNVVLLYFLLKTIQTFQNSVNELTKLFQIEDVDKDNDRVTDQFNNLNQNSSTSSSSGAEDKTAKSAKETNNKKGKNEKSGSFLSNPIFAIVILAVTIIYFVSKFVGGDPMEKANDNAIAASKDSATYSSGESCITSGLAVSISQCNDDKVCAQAHIRRYINPCMQALGGRDANLLKIPCSLNKQEFISRFCSSVSDKTKKEECENLAALTQSKGNGSICEKYHMMVFNSQKSANASK